MSTPKVAPDPIDKFLELLTEGLENKEPSLTKKPEEDPDPKKDKEAVASLYLKELHKSSDSSRHFEN